MKKWLKYLLLSLVVVVVVLFILKKRGIIGAPEAIKVSVTKAGLHDVIQTVTANGKIYPEVQVSISSDVPGEVVSLPVKEGDSVSKGQVVAKIYADIYNSVRSQAAASTNQTKAQLANSKANMQVAKAALDQSEAAYQRNKQLYEDKVISAQQYDEIYSSYQQAKANYEASQKQVDGASYAVKAAEADLQQATDNVHRTTILSPMSGYIIYQPVKEGERVVGTAQMAGTEIMRVADMGTMEVRVNVGENDAPKVYVGDTAIIEVDAYSNREFKGLVTQVASSSQDIASQSGNEAAPSSTGVTNYTVRIRILKDSYRELLDPQHPEHFPFRPGMSANVDIQTKKSTGVLAVPVSAVTTRTPGKGQDEVVVFVVGPDQKVSQKSVTVGIQDNNNAEILSGLEEGEEVISAPYEAISQTLKDGDQVQVVPRDQLF